jgi:hypothetical protein
MIWRTATALFMTRREDGGHGDSKSQKREGSAEPHFSTQAMPRSDDAEQEGVLGAAANVTRGGGLSRKSLPRHW